MKLTITKSALSPALAHVAGVVPRKAGIPILNNVLLVAKDGRLTITGGDMETTMSATVDADIKDEGEITVPARKLADIVKAADDELSFSLGDKMTVKTGRSRFTLATLPASDYPDRPAQDGKQINLPGADLRTLLDATAFAMATRDVRYYLNGLRIEVSDGMIHVVGTDGHRLATASTATDSENLTCIIPRDAVLAASKLVANHKGDATITVTASSVDVDIDGCALTSKLIDGKFPDWRRVIPKDNGITIEVDADELRGAMTRASILSNEKFKGVRMLLESGSITLTASNPEHEESQEVMDVDYKGEPVEIGFNVAYMIDALNAIESDTCTVALKDANTAALVTPCDDSGAVYVVMPMRL